jgi:hypothetical protein
MYRNQEQGYDGQEDYEYNQQYREADYDRGYPQQSPQQQGGKFQADDSLGSRDKARLQKDQERQFYLQQFKQAEFQEDLKRREEIDKKARAKQEMAESYQRQIQEKKERELQAKRQDAHFSRSTAENSSFASQDKQREQFLSKLKTGPQYEQAPISSKSNKTDIFNRDLTDRPPVQQQRFSDPNVDKLDQKKRMEREIFLENQKVASQKKADVHSQKNEQKYVDRHRAENDYAEYEKQQAVNRYSQAVQQQENYKALEDQIKTKDLNVDPYDRRYQAQPSSNQNDFLAGDSKLGYVKNKQRASGAGYNILTGM